MKTLILGNKSKLYIQSQGVSCNITATTHLMEFIKDSSLYPGSEGEENYEKVIYSLPESTGTNILVNTSLNQNRAIKEIYVYNMAGSAQVYSIRIRTYIDLTLLAGTTVGKKDHPDNYTDTCLIDITIGSLKVWRLSEAFLLSYPSVLVLDNQNMDEISIVTSPVSPQTLNDLDQVHVTMSHGVTGQTTWGISEKLTQKVILGAKNTSIYKLPYSASPTATVIKQICVYNASSKTIKVRVGFGAPTSSTLQGYIFDGNLAPNKSWWSDANTYQKIEDYLGSSGGSGGSLTLNTVQPLEYIPTGSIVKIAQGGATDKQVLGWDALTGEWRPQDNLEMLTPIAPLKYNLETLKLFIDGSAAVDGDVLTWKESTPNANDFAWRPFVGGSGGGGTSGAAGCGGGIPNRNLIIDGDFFYGSV